MQVLSRLTSGVIADWSSTISSFCDLVTRFILAKNNNLTRNFVKRSQTRIDSVTEIRWHKNGEGVQRAIARALADSNSKIYKISKRACNQNVSRLLSIEEHYSKLSNNDGCRARNACRNSARMRLSENIISWHSNQFFRRENAFSRRCTCNGRAWIALNCVLRMVLSFVRSWVKKIFTVPGCCRLFEYLRLDDWMPNQESNCGEWLSSRWDRLLLI